MRRIARANGSQAAREREEEREGAAGEMRIIGMIQKGFPWHIVSICYDLDWRDPPPRQTDRETERKQLHDAYRFTYVVGKLALDERVVRLAEVELRLLPRRVGRYDQCEAPRRLVRPGAERAVQSELPNQRRHVAEEEKEESQSVSAKVPSISNLILAALACMMGEGHLAGIERERDATRCRKGMVYETRVQMPASLQIPKM